MARISHSFCPKFLIQPTIRQQVPYLLQQSTVKSFCHPILLRSLSNCEVSWPSSRHNCRNGLLLYFLPLSYLSILIFLHVCNSILLLHSTMIPKTSLLYNMVYTQFRLEQSSTKETRMFSSKRRILRGTPNIRMHITKDFFCKVNSGAKLHLGFLAQ